MAKGIDINGQLRGKRGGVVYYRANGQQISRARNFNPKNPKTNAQMIQRAITATVMRMYSAGKEIFDHSFEGKSVPSGSQRAFMSENMRMLRRGITADLKAIENGTYEDEEALAAASPYRVVSPRSYGPTAAPYIISKGTYKNTALKTEISEDGICTLNLGIAPTAEETVAAWMGRSNIAEGDIFTIVYLSGTMADSSRVSSPELKFNVIRLVAKAPTTDKIIGKKVSDLFEITAKGADIATDLNTVATYVIATNENLIEIRGNEGEKGRKSWAIGRIVSRDDSGVRSNSVMQVLYGKDVDPFISVTAASLVESWQRAVESKDSPLILEGGKF